MTVVVVVVAVGQVMQATMPTTATTTSALTTARRMATADYHCIHYTCGSYTLLFYEPNIITRHSPLYFGVGARGNPKL